MKRYLFPFLYTLGIILIGSMFSSILYYFDITNDKINTIFLYLISIVAIFIGALNTGKNIKQKGIISGILYFTAWFLIMIFLSLVIFNHKLNFNSMIYYLILLIFSIMGAIIGKNNQTEIDTN